MWSAPWSVGCVPGDASIGSRRSLVSVPGFRVRLAHVRRRLFPNRHWLWSFDLRCMVWVSGIGTTPSPVVRPSRTHGPTAPPALHASAASPPSCDAACRRCERRKRCMPLLPPTWLAASRLCCARDIPVRSERPAKPSGACRRRRRAPGPAPRPAPEHSLLAAEAWVRWSCLIGFLTFPSQGPPSSWLQVGMTLLLPHGSQAPPEGSIHGLVWD